MAHKYCSHNFDINRCPTLGCKHNDTRALVTQLFGHDSNSKLAATIQRESPDRYKALADEARVLGLLPQIKIPRCLQSE